MTITELIEKSHALAIEKGWYQADKPRGVPELLCLVHSEVSEALEEYRNGDMADGEEGGGKPVGFGIELADTVIRIADICGYLKIDLVAAIEKKMAYNATRPHRHGGKLA